MCGVELFFGGGGGDHKEGRRLPKRGRLRVNTAILKPQHIDAIFYSRRSFVGRRQRSGSHTRNNGFPCITSEEDTLYFSLWLAPQLGSHPTQKQEKCSNGCDLMCLHFSLATLDDAVRLPVSLFFCFDHQTRASTDWFKCSKLAAVKQISGGGKVLYHNSDSSFCNVAFILSFLPSSYPHPRPSRLIRAGTQCVLNWLMISSLSHQYTCLLAFPSTPRRSDSIVHEASLKDNGHRGRSSDGKRSKICQLDLKRSFHKGNLAHLLRLMDTIKIIIRT